MEGKTEARMDKGKKPMEGEEKPNKKKGANVEMGGYLCFGGMRKTSNRGEKETAVKGEEKGRGKERGREAGRERAPPSHTTLTIEEPVPSPQNPEGEILSPEETKEKEGEITGEEETAVGADEEENKLHDEEESKRLTCCQRCCGCVETVFRFVSPARKVIMVW